MMEIKNILFTTDFSQCGLKGLDHALYLSRENNADLYLLHIIKTHRHDMIEPMQHVTNAEEIYKQLCKNAVDRLHELVTGKENGVTIHHEAITGVSVFESILEFIHTKDIDLIVIGTHGRHGVNRLIMGSVAEKIVRLAPCSVLTVRCESGGNLKETLKTIVVPVDFSEYSRNALKEAVNFANIYNATLHIVHIVEKFDYPSIYKSNEKKPELWNEDVKKKTYSEIERLVQEFGGDKSKTKIHIEKGQPVRDIIRYCKDVNADLVVIATHGLRGIEYLLMGSVSEKVVRYSECPVLTIKNKNVVDYLEEQNRLNK